MQILLSHFVFADPIQSYILVPLIKYFFLLYMFVCCMCGVCVRMYVWNLCMCMYVCISDLSVHVCVCVWYICMCGLYGICV